MDELPLPNSPEARTPTGELKEPSTSSMSLETKTDASAPTEPTARAPESYAEYTAPEGYKPDPDAVSTANSVFKELGLNQAQAQKLMDLQFQRDLAFSKNQETAISALREEWGNQLKSDPAIGTKLDSVKLDIGKALNHLDPGLRAEFQAAMNDTGVGNHPAFVKALYSLAQKVNEGTHVSGTPAPVAKPNGRPPAAQAMYPHLATQ